MSSLSCHIVSPLLSNIYVTYFTILSHFQHFITLLFLQSDSEEALPLLFWFENCLLFNTYGHYVWYVSPGLEIVQKATQVCILKTLKVAIYCLVRRAWEFIK